MLYANCPRYSASVSATLLFSGVTRLRQICPSGSVTDSTSGPSAYTVSPLHRKKSGRVSRIALKIDIPPKSGAIPQPCPTTSPVQTNRTSRRRCRPGAVVNDPVSGSLTSPCRSRLSTRTR